MEEVHWDVIRLVENLAVPPDHIWLEPGPAEVPDHLFDKHTIEITRRGQFDALVGGHVPHDEPGMVENQSTRQVAQ